MRYRKIISTLITMVFLAGTLTTMPLSAHADGPGWDEGQGWGYEWERNMKDMEPNITLLVTSSFLLPRYLDHLSLEGGLEQMLYIKYIGIENGSYLFEFKGGIKDDSSIVLNYHGEDGNGNTWICESNTERFLTSTYSGYFWLIEDISDEGYRGPQHYYGISKIQASVDSDIHTRRYCSYESALWNYSMDDSMHGNVSYHDLEISFTPSLPMLPMNRSEGINIAFSTDIAYSGYRYGHLALSSIYINTNSGNVSSTSVEEKLDGEIDGKIEQQFITAIYEPYEDGNTSLPMPFSSFSDICFLNEDDDREGHFRDINTVVFTGNRAERLDKEFVEKIYLQDTMFSFIPNSWQIDDIMSFPATESEVDNFLSSFDDENGNGDEGSTDETSAPGTGLILAGISVTVVLWGSIHRRNEKKINRRKPGK